MRIKNSLLLRQGVIEQEEYKVGEHVQGGFLCAGGTVPGNKRLYL